MLLGTTVYNVSFMDQLYKKAMIDSGIFELDTEEGKFAFVSDTSRYGLDRDSENLIGDLQAFIDGVNAM